MTKAEDVEEVPYARSLGVGVMAPQDNAVPSNGSKEPAGSSMNTDSSATEDINQMTKMSVKTEEGRSTKQATYGSSSRSTRGFASEGSTLVRASFLDFQYSQSFTRAKCDEDFDEEKEGADEPPVEIPGSTHAFLFTTQAGSVPFNFSVIIILMSTICLLLALVFNLQYGLQEDYLGIPVNVKWEVR